MSGATPTSGTTNAPPVGAADDGRPAPHQERAGVLVNEPVGAYHHLILGVSGGVELAAPGQFVALAVGDAPTATLLRRAFSLHRATPSGPRGGIGSTVEVVVAAHGPGSTWVTRRRPGDVVDVIGPLGRPFPEPAPGTHCVLVGGGYGSAPLVWWAQQLRARGCRVDAVVGAADADRLFGVAPLERFADRVRVTTDDGSAGSRGRVTDVLPELVDAGTQVYSCGPMAMLRAVTEVTHAAGGRSWCAVEEAMACGIGICMTCVMPLRGNDGRTRMTRSCVEGPTFDGAAVRWDAIGAGPGGTGSAVPEDCVGAPRATGGH